jgi:hypothetical protein
MAAKPALWADIQRDLQVARNHVAKAAVRARMLGRRGKSLPDDVRIDREYAIAVMLHHAYGAMEGALERLIRAVDGDLPTGVSYHAEIIRRAATPIEGVRSAIITRSTASGLHRLRSFRHAFRHTYYDYDHARAAENVPLAVQVARSFRAELSAFAKAIKLTTSKPTGHEEPD